MKKIAVILSGCGVFDGSEIHEATLALLAIKKAGCVYSIFAPNTEQAEVVNHFTGVIEYKTRNMLEEAGRIARGEAQPLENLNLEDFDAIIFPGGYGVAKNFSDYAYIGGEYSVIPAIRDMLKKAYKLKKPIGAMCIAPILLAEIFIGCRITLGDINEDSEFVQNKGAVHVVTNHGETVVDYKYKLVTTPGYMLDADIVQIAEGADNLVKELLKLI